MITNLLATVVLTLVTNVTERLPMIQVSDPVPIGKDGFAPLVYRYHEEPNPNATSKWIRTTVKEVEALEYDFRGKRQLTVLSERVVSDVEVEQALVKTEKWVPTATNDVADKTLIDGRWFSRLEGTNWSITNIMVSDLYWTATNKIQYTGSDSNHHPSIKQ